MKRFSFHPSYWPEACISVTGLAALFSAFWLYPPIATVDLHSRHPISQQEADQQVSEAKEQLKAREDDFNAYSALAIAYFQKGPDFYVDSINALKRARDLGAVSEEFFYYAGVMYTSLGLPDYALDELTKYLRHHPEDYEARIRLANVYFQLKRYPEALSLYKDSLNRWPNDGTAWYNCAVAYKEAGDNSEALKAMNKAKEIAGELPAEGNFQEGEIYRGLGNEAQAEAAYRQELKENEFHLPSLEALQDILQRRGDIKAARTVRQQIVNAKKALKDKASSHS